MKQLIQILLIPLLVYLWFNAIYLFVFALIAFFTRNKKQESNPVRNRFLLLYPAYKGDNVILNSVRECGKLTYDREKFTVCVIADRLKQETVAEIRSMGHTVVEVHFENSTKSKSLNAALDAIDISAYDYALILDIDNVMEPAYLNKLNDGLATSPLIVQTHRVAKNLDTDMAVLDAVSEEINNSIFRKGHVSLGLSSALIGSGIAMKITEFKALMKEIQAVGGFDKEMEVSLLRDARHIGYLEDALVYDEKVQDSAIFENQRKRWLSAQFHYLGLYFFDSLKHLVLKANFDYFDKLLQFLLLPRVMILGLSLVVGVVALLFPDWFPGGKNAVCIPLLILISLYLATPKWLRNKRTLVALRRIPLTFLILFRTLFRLKGANKKFIHTPHS